MIKTVMLAGALALSVSGAALADNTTNGSACGQAHAARADVYGPPAIGAGGAPSLHNGAHGQQPDATGYNNSHTNCQATPD
jgi:hypothetical protein